VILSAWRRFADPSAHRAIPPEQDGDRIMSVPILYTIDAGTSTGYRPATLEEIMTSARDALNRRVRKGVALTSPQLTRDYLTAKLGTREFETFCCLFLDNRHRVIDFVELFRGTIDGASVHPREVVKEALKRNAAALVFAHPHPSGIAEPSAADELITQRLREALQLVDIRVLDHIIIAGGEAVSFAERGLI
jgi:DNA repair protein RadC